MGPPVSDYLHYSLYLSSSVLQSSSWPLTTRARRDRDAHWQRQVAAVGGGARWQRWVATGGSCITDHDLGTSSFSSSPFCPYTRPSRRGGCPAKATVMATPDALSCLLRRRLQPRRASSPSPPQPPTIASTPLPLSLLFPHLFPVHESDRREAAVPVVTANRARAAGEERVCDSICTLSSPRRGHGTRRMARPWRS